MHASDSDTVADTCAIYIHPIGFGQNIGRSLSSYSHLFFLSSPPCLDFLCFFLAPNPRPAGSSLVPPPLTADASREADAEDESKEMQYSLSGEAGGLVLLLGPEAATTVIGDGVASRKLENFSGSSQ